MTATGPAPDDPDPAVSSDLALASLIAATALAGTGARAETLLGVPAVRIGDRVVARVLDGALLLAPSEAVIPPPPAGMDVETVRPWSGAQPHLRVAPGSLAPATSDPARDAGADADEAGSTSPAAAWIRAAVLATAERVPAVRLPEPPARIPHPRRPRT